MNTGRSQAWLSGFGAWDLLYHENCVRKGKSSICFIPSETVKPSLEKGQEQVHEISLLCIIIRSLKISSIVRIGNGSSKETKSTNAKKGDAAVPPYVGGVKLGWTWDHEANYTWRNVFKTIRELSWSFKNSFMALNTVWSSSHEM